MAGTPERAKPSTPIYGIYSSASPHVIYTSSVKEVRAHLSTPELRDSGGRFKTFPTLEEGELFFANNPVSKMMTPTRVAAKVEDGYRSPFAKLKPQEHSKFLKLIQEHKNNEALELMDQNPHYFIDMSIDQPSILHIGCRHNTLHLCARFNNLFIAMEVMKRIKDLAYIATIYKTDANTEETSDNLIDRFLNTPDKSSRRTPLLWAARQGFDKMVMFLSSFPEAQLPNNAQINEVKCQFHDRGRHSAKCDRIVDSLRHPSKTYCVTLYKEKNNDEMPFIAITSRFPHAHVAANQKQSYFHTIPASMFTGRAEDGSTSIRVSKFLDGKHLSHAYRFDGSTATSAFVPYASLGVFGEKWIAALFYQMWSAECKRGQKDPASFCDYLSNFAVSLADLNDYFVFFAKMSGMVIPESKCEKFINKLRAVKTEDSECELEKAMKKLTVKDFKSFVFNVTKEIDDDSIYSTPASSPLRK